MKHAFLAYTIPQTSKMKTSNAIEVIMKYFLSLLVVKRPSENVMCIWTRLQQLWCKQYILNNKWNNKFKVIGEWYFIELLQNMIHELLCNKEMHYNNMVYIFTTWLSYLNFRSAVAVLLLNLSDEKYSSVLSWPVAMISWFLLLLH